MAVADQAIVSLNTAYVLLSFYLHESHLKSFPGCFPMYIPHLGQKLNYRALTNKMVPVSMVYYITRTCAIHCLVS